MLGRSLLFASLVAFSAHGVFAQSADLRFTSVSASTGAPSGAASATVFFHNNGPSAAADFQLTIALPDGMTYLGVSAPPLLKCTGPPVGSKGTLTCTAKSVNNDDGGSALLTGRIDPSVAPGTVLSFPITMTSSNALQPSQSATATMTVSAPADLAISATPPTRATAGDAIVTTIDLTNNGPADANGVSVFLDSSFATPQHMTGPPGWDCSVSKCSLDQPFPPGSVQFALTSLLPISSDPTVAQKISTSSSNDPDDRNNTVLVTTAVDPVPRTTLKVVVTQTPENFYSGDTVTYSATVTNTGPSTAYNVTLGLQIDKGDVFFGTCGASSAVICTYPALAAGATQTIVGKARMWAPPGSQVREIAFAHGFNFDTDTNVFVTTVNGTPPPNRRRAVHH